VHLSCDRSIRVVVFFYPDDPPAESRHLILVMSDKLRKPEAAAKYL